MRSQIIAEEKREEMYLKQLNAALHLELGDKPKHYFHYAFNDSNNKEFILLFK